LPSLLIGLQAVLCAVFGASTWSKLVSQGAFAESLRGLSVVPERLVRPAAAAVTAAELTIALGLGWAMVGRVAQGPAGQAPGLVSLLLAGLLLTVLSTGIVLALRRGALATCACFGATERPLGPRHLVRNGVLLGVVIAGLAVLGLGGDGRAEAAGAVIGLTAGAAGALILIRLDDLVELFVPIHRSDPAPRTRS
jgi:hypothetical protein